ncbi:LysR family transcriptional regulator [Fusobacterium simiae]|uniref:LysR family transcriptional regulator n=1 Tax=Fusobacterium TaxID=848 RepID=UPI00040AF018|nr:MULTISPECIES: LysR family transcriptional regulator [Fusobacterium]MDC7954649.1 LysR family transcriptional regulator [Fusobacterium simiae]WDD88856.1 LysR family transcriptional regulator [Fusobacterium nucleatum]
MNLISLYYFTELAKELHVTNTSQRLYISQQNLTQHIQRLEQHYGVLLFVRKPKLALTYAGEQLLITANKILAEEADLINRLSSISKTGAGRLRLGIPSYRANICLPYILPEFYEKWPNIKIQIVDETSDKTEQMLFDNELDLFIGIKYKDDPRLNTFTLLNDHIYVAVSDELLKKYYEEDFNRLKEKVSTGIDIKEVAKLPFLLQKGTSRLRNTINSCFKNSNIQPNIFMEATTTELLFSLFSFNYGAIFCTQMRLNILKNINPHVNAFPIKMKNEFIKHRLVLAYHKEYELPEYLEDFINITKKAFKEIIQ